MLNTEGIIAALNGNIIITKKVDPRLCQPSGGTDIELTKLNT